MLAIDPGARFPHSWELPHMGGGEELGSFGVTPKPISHFSRFMSSRRLPNGLRYILVEGGLRAEHVGSNGRVPCRSSS